MTGFLRRAGHLIGRLISSLGYGSAGGETGTHPDLTNLFTLATIDSFQSLAEEDAFFSLAEVSGVASTATVPTVFTLSSVDSPQSLVTVSSLFTLASINPE